MNMNMNFNKPFMSSRYNQNNFSNKGNYKAVKRNSK